MQNVVDHRPKLAAITDEQATRLQINPEAYLDQWFTIVGMCIKV